MIKYVLLLLTMIFTSTTPLAAHSGTKGESMRIYFLDVGQGDAMVINQPGVCTMLVDAGPLLHGHRVTEKLLELEVTELNTVIISHPHLDHFGGLFDIHSRIGIKQLLDNGRENPIREYFSDYQKIQLKQPYKPISHGDLVACGDIRIEVLSPTSHANKEEGLNATSLVLMISYADFKLLHMGDCAGPAEQLFLQENPDIAADVLKVAHHGAADATSAHLLDKVSPELAIISTSEDNWIDAPSQIVLDRLSGHNIDYLRTDRHGTIELAIKEDGTFSIVDGM